MARSHGGLDETRQITKEALRVWEALFRLTHMSERLERQDIILGSITLRPPSGDGSDWLSVCRVSLEGRPHVGFVSGSDVAAVLQSVVNMLENGTMKWREDQYANKQGSR